MKKGDPTIHLLAAYEGEFTNTRCGLYFLWHETTEDRAQCNCRACLAVNLDPTPDDERDFEIDHTAEDLGLERECFTR